MKRITLAQNFLINRSVVLRLVERSSITDLDTVFEIGAGRGIITRELLKKAKKVVAFEIDSTLGNKLIQELQGESSLEIKLTDFLSCDLPAYPYKVFSNIPFNITSAVIKKLTQAENPPEDAYLIVQKEAAGKFMGMPVDNKNSLMAILLKPWFDFEIFYRFKRDDFSPRPGVNVIMLRIRKKEKPLVKINQKSQFEDFVAHTFNQFKPKMKPSKIDFSQWLKLFDIFMKGPGKSRQQIAGFYSKLKKQQEQLEKIHRTRVDKNWKHSV